MTAPKFTVAAYVSVTVKDENGRPVAEVVVNEQDGPNAAVKALAESVLTVTTDRIVRMLAADFGEPDADGFPTVSPDVLDVDLTMPRGSFGYPDDDQQFPYSRTYSRD